MGFFRAGEGKSNPKACSKKRPYFHYCNSSDELNCYSLYKLILQKIDYGLQLQEVQYAPAQPAVNHIPAAIK